MADVQRLEKANDAQKLRHYLIQVAKWSEKPKQYENILSSYLYSPEADLREAAVFSLLFALQIRKPEYRQVAVQQLVETHKEDSDARQWAAASLAVAYQNTKDPELLRIFFTILDNEEEDNFIRSSIARDILLIWGMSTRECLLRISSFTASLKAILLEFELELAQARQAAQKQ